MHAEPAKVLFAPDTCEQIDELLRESFNVGLSSLGSTTRNCEDATGEFTVTINDKTYSVMMSYVCIVNGSPCAIMGEVFEYSDDYSCALVFLTQDFETPDPARKVGDIPEWNLAQSVALVSHYEADNYISLQLMSEAFRIFV